MRENFGNLSKEQPAMQGGQFFESALFKKCTENSPEEYSSYKDSMEWVKAHQPKKDLSNPETLDSPQFSHLKSEIIAKLPNVDNVLKFNTAVGSNLDLLHGVDGFFELGDDIVTVDLTLNPEKEVGKADVVILADEELGMTEEMTEYASSKIAEKFIEKIEQKKRLDA